MKWDESKMSTSVDCLKRRIKRNEYAESFWMRYWELHCAKRWRVVETPVLSYRRAGGACAGKPMQTYYPVEAAEPMRVGLLTGQK